VTGDVDTDYLQQLEQARNDGAKQEREKGSETGIDLYNTA
jgi:hypothetical protein